MKINGYSQLPARDGEKIVGSLTERGLMRKFTETEQKDLAQLKVRDVVEDPFPVVNVKTPISLIVDLLLETQAIMSSSAQGIVGIVTKTDVVSKAIAHSS
jgi:predicted transcriptional regulator